MTCGETLLNMHTGNLDIFSSCWEVNFWTIFTTITRSYRDTYLFYLLDVSCPGKNQIEKCKLELALVLHGLVWIHKETLKHNAYYGPYSGNTRLLSVKDNLGIQQITYSTQIVGTMKCITTHVVHIFDLHSKANILFKP